MGGGSFLFLDPLLKFFLGNFLHFKLYKAVFSFNLDFVFNFHRFFEL